jgi:hypothetical protein
MLIGGEAWLMLRECDNTCERACCGSTPTGDMAPWNPKPGDLACDGDETWDEGVAWNCGDGIP